MVTGLPDPDRSRVVLVGASSYAHLAALPAVTANVAAMQEVFASEAVWGLPAAHCTVLHDPHGPREVSQAIKDAAREATDALIFYYAGHGLIDPATGELYLALHDSHAQEVYDSAVPYQWIRRPFEASRAARRVVVLDCCYSGRMLGAMSEGLGLAEIDGTYLLAAAAENALALAPPGEFYTAFTGELVTLLHHGVPGAGESLTLNEIYEKVRSSLCAAERPEPQCRDRNALGTVPFVLNSAYQPRTTAATEPPEATMRRFVADMAHELRTPLTALSAVSEVLEEKAGRLDPTLQPAVQLVVGETRRLNDLVDKMMDLARLDSGTVRLATREVDVAQEVEACLEARNWTGLVTLDMPRPMPAELDPWRLGIILASVIDNALRHGGAPVVVTGTPRPRELFIEVADSGGGIPEEALPYVFDRFFKAGSRRPRSEGSGLGLSIAQATARLMGGDIRAANRAEGGAEFTVRLPRRAKGNNSCP
ncbi:caspase, EACC1-associated type [Streptomyces sp. NRRL S-337]|uniref:caspase, EACC1-associated type n=1 Tax=Streptomyces sp. NRRL S-337 TaxID=1463900 RepID=UPI00099CC832|nr:ATP-binding protein [Streptomyces sp. NRRL S-337]